MEQVVEFVTRLDVIYIYVAVFLISYIENIFPPFPSDVIVVFCGSLVAVGRGDVLITLVLSTGGSTLGFITMYKIGAKLGDTVLEKGRIKFIPVETVYRVEQWFRKYGYWVVIANRFMAGTRAVVSFFAGMSELHLPKTVLLSAVSALLWNTILVYSGFMLGNNWREIGDYLARYSTVVSICIGGALIAWGVGRYFISRAGTHGGAGRTPGRKTRD